MVRRFLYCACCEVVCAQTCPCFRPDIPWDDVRAKMMSAERLQNPLLQCQDHFWEVFCPPRIAPLIRSKGLSSQRSVDKLTGWDMSNDQVLRQLCIDWLSLRPLFVLVCPPCTFFSQLMYSNWPRMNEEKKNADFAEALKFLDFAMHLCRHQVRVGGYYIFEHPQGASSWKRASVPRLQSLPFASACY